MSAGLGALFASGFTSAAAQGAANQGASYLGQWASNTARESLNKNIGKTNLKIQKAYDEWTLQQDARYEKWYQDLIYNLQANEYYDLAKRYGTNTASWAVEGLKKAGLNPVLAAIDSNLSSSLGNASPQGSTGRHSKSVPSSSAPSTVSPSNIRLSALQDLANSAKQGELLDVQKSNIEADTRNKEQDTINKSQNEGLTGGFAVVNQLLKASGLKDDMKSLAKEGVNWLKRKIGMDSASPTSAKAAADAASSYDPKKDSAFRGVVVGDDETSKNLDKVNAHGLRIESEKSPLQREKERRLRNGRKNNILFHR